MTTPLLPTLAMRTTFFALLLVGCSVRAGDAQDATLKPQQAVREATRWGEPIPASHEVQKGDRSR